MNILVTSASRKVNLVQTFKSALEPVGGKIIAIDSDPLSPALYFAHKFYIVPPSTDPNFLEIVLTICKSENVVAIIPTRDEDLLFFSERKSMLASENIVAVVSDKESIELCQDKRRFHHFCVQNAIPVPKLLDTKASFEMQFPVFVKPVIGKGGLGAQLVETQADLENRLNECPDLMVQEFISADEYTVDVFVDFSGEILSAIPRKRMRISSGESCVTRTEYSEAIISETCKLVSRLNLIGHITVQCFKKDDRILFIEVNPRFGGAAHLGFVAGANTPNYIVQLLSGKKVDSTIGVFKDNLTLLRFSSDIFLDAKMALWGDSTLD